MVYVGSDRYADLTDRDFDDAEDSGAADAALDGASSLADSYIAQYLPLSTVPNVLVTRVYDVAVYELAGNRRTDDERQRYEDALRWFRDIAAKRAFLQPPEGGGGGAVLEVDAPDHAFMLDQTRRIL